MLRSYFLGSVFALVCCGFARSQEGPKLKPVILPDAIHYVQHFTDDRLVGTMIFDNFVTDTEIGRGSLPSVASKKLTYALQTESTGDATVKQIFRGFIATQGTGSAALVVHAGGKSTLVDWDKAIADAKATPRKADSKEWKAAVKRAQDEGFTVGQRPERADDFLLVIDTPVAAGKPLQTHIFMLVDRLVGNDDGAAHLSVDSIDFVISAAETGKAKKR
jgi:hypothetical protein